MMINNLKLRKACMSLALSSSLALGLTGCNKQMVDFNKSFNVGIEPNGDSISVVPVYNYKDYEGSQVQFVTDDNLVVLSSTYHLQLMKFKSNTELNNYIDVIKDSNDIVNYFSENIEYGDIFNKNVLDLQYSFDKAIIVMDDSVLLVDITSWKDYDDDQIQVKYFDGSYNLTNVANIKLLDDTNAKEDSAYKYAVTLAGSEDKVKIYTRK